MEQNSYKDTDIRLLSIPEACERLGIGHWMAYRLIHQGSLKTVKIGKRRLVSTRAVDRFIDSMEQ